MSTDSTAGMLAHARSEIAKWKAVEAALLGTAPLPEVPVSARRKRIGVKAPNGTLQAAITRLLHHGKKMTNGEIRAALHAQKYEYSLTPELVRQTLVGMREKKEVVGEEGDNGMRYSLVKG